MTSVLVGHAGDVEHAVGIGVVERLLSKVVHVDGAESALHHPHAMIGRVHDCLGEGVDVGDEAVADPHGEKAAVGTATDAAMTVVAFGGCVAGFTGAVAIAGVVVRVVVILHEVPTRDVVDVAVVVVVDAI